MNVFYSSSISGGDIDTEIHLLPDNSGYFVISRNSNSRPYLCKYLFSTSSSAQCQQVNTISAYAYGQLMINNNEFFVSGTDPTTPFHLHYYKITFGNTAVDWANKILCTSGTCSTSSSEVLLDSSNSYIYNFSIYRNSSNYLYFVTLALSDGSVVGSRYKSSVSCGYVYGSAQTGNYLVATVSSSSGLLVIVDKTTFTFTFRGFNGVLFGAAVDLSNLMFVTTGIKSSTGYMTKFLPESSNSHPDFSSSTIVMNVLSSGTNDIVSETGVTIGSSTLASVSSFSPSIQTAAYVLISRTDMEEASSSSQCGDGNKQSSVGEECDDANTVSGDGCSNTCKVESGFECNQDQTSNISICIKVCGNGKVDPSELCDDGNISNDDGCSNTCQVEQEYACTTIDSNRSNSYCSKICGNGKINDGEQCDDKNNNLGDGCNSECELESGYIYMK